MRAVTELRRTAWYIPEGDNGGTYSDGMGHIWFSKEIAMEIGRTLGEVPMSTSSGGLKNVVISYETERGN